MTTTYQPPPLAHHDGHVLSSYPSGLAQSRGPLPAVGEPARAPQTTRYFQPQQQQRQQQQQQQQQSYALPQSQPRHATSVATQYSTTSGQSTRDSTPAADSITHKTQTMKADVQALAQHSLQIPRCISAKGGNLADFAAEITCLFWFESTDTLKAAETIRARPVSTTVPRLAKHAIPHAQFKKWTYSILSTTQVTQCVVLLALLFVYRLKKTNQGVKGRPGSEYRLLTVALMLGNKFLDDNTYTNKTWAEVSSIPVQEIHVMEVEFLSNMRYSLLASKDEWEAWLSKLSCFHDYYERAICQPTSPIALSSPTSQILNSPQPSAGGIQQPPVLQVPTSSQFSPSSYQPNGQAWASTYQQGPPTSPLAAKSQLSVKRRASEDAAADHPAKRISMPPCTMPQARPPVVGEQPIRLPVPNLTVNTTSGQGPYMMSTGSYPSANTNPGPNANPAASSSLHPNASQVSLPPLVSGMRAMATVYPTTSGPAATAQLPLPATTVPSSNPQASLTPTSTLAPQANLNYGTPSSRRQSPGTLAPFGSSPLAEPYPAALHTPISHTPISLSPSVYLQHKRSPYKPIRHVNTLLYPPPSASLNEYHMASAPQMHYLPLGRRNDLRTGVVPDYVAMGYRSVPSMQLPTHGLPQDHY